MSPDLNNGQIFAVFQSVGKTPFFIDKFMIKTNIESNANLKVLIRRIEIPSLPEDLVLEKPFISFEASFSVITGIKNTDYVRFW
jgi:hypothetical protein